MFLVGLTGGIASGKSTVSKMLLELGCPLIDADKVARQVVEPGKPAWHKIKVKFGDDVFLEDGNLDRERLGDVIFADSEKRKALNAITHPEIYKAMCWMTLSYLIKGEQFVVFDVPLLFESGKMLPYMAYTVVVSCDPDTQMGRLKNRNHLTTEAAQQRIDAQMPLADKCYQATDVIDNSGTIEQTKLQVENLYKELRRSRRHLFLRILLMAVMGSFIGLSGYLMKIL